MLGQKFELLRLKEIVGADTMKWYAVQFAVDGVPCTPFYDCELHRRNMGEEQWMEMLKGQAAAYVDLYGRAPVLTE